MPRRETELRGILVAVATPMTSDTAVDEEELARHVDWLIGHGIHGLVPTGSTGEFTTLTPDEHKLVIDIVVQAAGGRVPVFPGTGSISTALAVELSRHAVAAGADGVMVVPPFYDPPDAGMLRAYLQDISDAIDVPILYYNIPGVTGVRLSAEELAALAEIDGVRYLKDTSGDAVALTELLMRHDDRITAFNGWDSLTFLGLALGAKGSVWGAANIIPGLAVQLWETVAVHGDLEEGRRLWRQIWPICDFLEAHNYVAGVKAGMELVGRSAGPARRPVLPLSASEVETFAHILGAAGARDVADA